MSNESGDNGMTQEGNKELKLGAFSERFMRTRITNLYTKGVKISKDTCYDIVDIHGDVLGVMNVVSSKAAVDIRTLTTRAVQSAGHSSLLGFYIGWFSTHDAEAYEEWAAANEIPSSRVSTEFHEWMMSRPKRVCNARHSEVEFVSEVERIASESTG